MRDQSSHVEVTRDEALDRLLGACAFAPGTETLPLGDAFGRVLAQDLRARLELARSRNARCVLETKTVAALERSVRWLKSEGIM